MNGIDRGIDTLGRADAPSSSTASGTLARAVCDLAVPGMNRVFALCLATMLLAAAGVRADEQPVAQVTGASGKVRVEVLSLKRMEGGLVMLRWRIVNDDNRSVSMAPVNAKLVDLIARREYSAGLWSNSCGAEPGQRTICWASFAAPPTTTKAMAIRFYERLDLVTGVPITD